MQLLRLDIQGFRCFQTRVSIPFDKLTALIGANGCGKTAALMALVRMFGTTNAQRTLIKRDLFLSADAADVDERQLIVDAVFEFPELLADADAASSTAIPECLRHILITAESEVPRCRIMLKATWRKSASAEGDIEQKLLWVDSADVDPGEEETHPLHSVERSLIQVFYVPATRDAAHELKMASGTILSRALQQVAWSDSIRVSIERAAQELNDVVRSEDAIQRLEALLAGHWATLRNDDKRPTFSLVEDDLSNVLRGLKARLDSEGTESQEIDLLSEGERSLMYFALLRSALDFERQFDLAGAATSSAGVPRAVLTILAIEEPENHLAPQYLGRILASIRGAVAANNAQAVLTSHSASLMRRIEPTEVRHVRAVSTGLHIFSRLTLPTEHDEAFKYVREAVRAHPELYFARAVVLCEGPSEEVIIPRVAQALGLDVDPKFVAVVPLGGRHVNHFWRLLRQLDIPHVTLLDLDLGRRGGDWRRLCYAMSELLKLGEPRDRVVGSIDRTQFEAMAAQAAPRTATDANLHQWLVHLETNFGVFFSFPLDVDLAMLEGFPARYQALAPPGGGPNLPTESRALKRRLTSAIRAVLGSDGDQGKAYPAAGRGLFPWYSYLFLSGSKPATHAAMLAKIQDTELLAGCPKVIERLIARVKSLVASL